MVAIAGLGKTDRIDSGTGVIRQRTIEIGDAVIALHNVGSMILVTETRNRGGPIIGLILMIILLFYGMLESASIIFIIAIAGGVFCLLLLTRAADTFLSIGTSDSKSFLLVSTNRKFLIEVREFLREKIDSNSLQTATINISAGTITGGVAVGDRARATGAGGNLNNGAPE